MQLVVHHAQSAGVKTLGVILPDDAYGANLTSFLTPSAKSAGISLDEATFSDSAVSMISEWEKVLAGHPQMIFFDGNGAQIANLLSSRLNAGAVSIPAVGGQGVGTISLPQVAPAASLKNLLVGYWSVQREAAGGDMTQARQTMLNQLAKNKVTISQPLDVYTLAYDYLMYYATAAKQAGSTSPAAVSQAMENLKVTGARPWATWSDGLYTTTDHFPTNLTSDFVLAAPGIYKDGVVSGS
jgi:ABC-type branched-subunit amino acid transport system substrate-binding protein